MSGIDTDEHDIEPSTSGCRYVLFIYFYDFVLFYCDQHVYYF